MKNKIKYTVLVVLVVMVSLTTVAEAKEIVIEELSDYDCQGKSEWHFVLNGGGEPDIIHVEFEDGEAVDVPLREVTGNAAHYYLEAEEYVKRLARVSASVPDGWSGQFRVSHGPCPTDLRIVSFSARQQADIVFLLVLILVIVLSFAVYRRGAK